MKEKLFSWIEKSIDIAIELETELTKRPAISPDSGGEGELDKCLFLEDWLRSFGITRLERYDVPDIRAKGGVRPNLIATIDGASGACGASGDKRLWIMSHLDVVPPGDIKLWKNDPFTVVKQDDSCGIRLTGLGVEDNQQGIVASVLAALSFIKQGLKPALTIKLLFAADEEVGSAYGINYLVKNNGDLFRKNDMVLVPDGGDLNGEHIEIAEKNIVWIRFLTQGKQAHGARPDTGTNSFLAGSELVLRLHNELSCKFSDKDTLFNPDYSTFQPTKKEANVHNVNTIPGEDIFYYDIRILPRYSISSVLNEVDKIKAEIEEKHKVKIEYSIVQSTESKPTSVDSEIVKNLSSAISQVYNVKPYPVGIGGGTMAAALRNIGIDCAVWTKTEQSLHKPNEYVLMENIIGDAKVMALLAIG
jgi:succinyl-diaminopimelate desuccinylase